MLLYLSYSSSHLPFKPSHQAQSYPRATSRGRRKNESINQPVPNRGAHEITTTTRHTGCSWHPCISSWTKWINLPPPRPLTSAYLSAHGFQNTVRRTIVQRLNIKWRNDLAQVRISCGFVNLVFAVVVWSYGIRVISCMQYVVTQSLPQCPLQGRQGRLNSLVREIEFYSTHSFKTSKICKMVTERW